MGNSSCATCDCRSDKELKSSFISEVVTLTSKKKEPVGASSPQTSSFDYSKTQNSIILIQTLWRGYTTRKEYLHLFKVKNNGRFFSREDALETLKPTRVFSKSRETRNVYTYRSGAIYQGQWRGGFRDGFGTQIWPGNNKYEGNWSYGWPCGIGKFTFANGDMYEGCWKWIWASGQASVCISGSTAVNGFTSGISDGYLWLWYKNQLSVADRFQRRNVLGSKRVELEAKLAKIKRMLEEPKKLIKDGMEPSDLFKANLRVFMRKEYEDGKVYEGEFAGDRRDGRGKVVWANGDVYEGEWRDDKHHGYGQNIWINGSSYFGSYKENMKHGIGDYKWEDGSSYVGEWYDNKMQGVGEYVWPDGRKFTGEWVNGVMQGFGVLQWKNGKRYEGGWEQGKKHGEGVTTTADGVISRDIWKAGKVLKVTSS